MNKLKKCSIIFIEEVKNNDDIEHILDNVKIRIGKVSNSRYYANLNKSIEIASVGFIQEDIMLSSPHQMRFIEIDGIRYKCSRYSEIAGKRLMIDLVEVK